MESPLYTLSEEQRADSRLAASIASINANEGVSLRSYHDLHQWSIQSMASFWRSVWQSCGVIGEPGSRILIDDGDMLDARFFPDARLNYAENLLRRRDDSDALVFWGEDRMRSRMSWRDLYRRVSQAAQALSTQGSVRAIASRR